MNLHDQAFLLRVTSKKSRNAQRYARDLAAVHSLAAAGLMCQRGNGWVASLAGWEFAQQLRKGVAAQNARLLACQRHGESRA